MIFRFLVLFFILSQNVFGLSFFHRKHACERDIAELQSKKLLLEQNLILFSESIWIHEGFKHIIFANLQKTIRSLDDFQIKLNKIYSNIEKNKSYSEFFMKNYYSFQLFELSLQLPIEAIIGSAAINHMFDQKTHYRELLKHPRLKDILRYLKSQNKTEILKEAVLLPIEPSALPMMQEPTAPPLESIEICFEDE